MDLYEIRQGVNTHPVSYTHLDVYKRQGYSVLDVVNTFAKVNAIEVPYQIDPVSYTHLP